MERSDQKPQHAAKFLRQRKFLMIAPLFVLPFVVLLAWTLGIVGDAKSETTQPSAFQGLNLNLPAAAPARDSNWNKLKYYEQADKDSAKLKSQLKNDHFFQRRAGEQEDTDTGLDETYGAGHFTYDPYPENGKHRQDRNEQKVYEKLARLQRELDKAPEPVSTEAVRPAAASNPDVDRLENMMQQMTRDKGPDTELTQLNDMLTKILDIQNPERVQEKLREQSEKHKQQAFALQAPPEELISVLEAGPDYAAMLARYHTDTLPETLKAYMAANRFYSLEDATTETTVRRAIAAVIPEDQTLVSGATLGLRLSEDIYVAGVKIPKGHAVHGQATLNGERLQVSISAIEYENYVLPVALTVYDKKDGLPGIHIPGAITRDVAKKSAAQSVQGLGQLTTLDPSFGAQMATAGLQMAQNLVGKSAKLIWVTVEAGYPVLLKDDNQKDK